jgi:allantoin racemase
VNRHADPRRQPEHHVVQDRLRAEIARAVAEDRCEAIILGCAGMADLSRALAVEFGLPVIDGVAAAVRLVEAVVGLGLGTSKAGGYASPLPKRYAGELERFAP